MRLALAALGLLASSAGCVNRATMRDPHEGQFKLTFRNDSNVRVCELHLYLVGETDRGPNRLAAGTQVAPGQLFALWTSPATYQVFADACPDEKKPVSGFTTNVELNVDSDVVLYNDDDPKSKQAAETWAHDHHNVTLVPVKYNAKTARPR